MMYFSLLVDERVTKEGQEYYLFSRIWSFSTLAHTSSSVLSSMTSCSLLTSPVSDFKNAVIFECFFYTSSSACFKFLFSFPDLYVRPWSLSRFVQPHFFIFEIISITISASTKWNLVKVLNWLNLCNCITEVSCSKWWIIRQLSLIICQLSLH